MNGTLLTSLAALVLPLAAIQAQDTPLWRYRTTEKIEFYRLTPLGDLLVGTKDEVVVLDPETGEVRWTRNDILKKPGGIVINPGPLPGAAFAPIPFSPFGVVRTKDGIAMIDLGTGETMWDSTAVPLEKVRGYLTVPQHKMVLVYGETPESKRTLIAVDVVTGEVGWRQDTLFRRSSPNLQRINSLRSLTGHQQPIVDSDTTFILNLSKDGPMRIHSRTGKLLWRLDLNKNPPLLREGYAPMLYDSGVLFVPYDKKLVAVNVADGSIIWDRRRNFWSRLTQMELTSHGLLVRGRKPPERECTGPDECIVKPATDFFLDLVNAETGTSVWPTPIRDVRTDIPFIVDGDAIFVTREREFVAFNFLDASPMTIAEFEFEGGEQPLLVQMVGTNFLISANQNILSLGRAGNVEYQRYYEPPGRSWLENAAILLSEAFVAATVYKCLDLGAVGAAGAASLMSQRDFRARAFEACTGATVENPDSVLPPSAEDAVNWANYTYVYTKQPSSTGRDGFSLVKLDVRNGKEVARVWIDERRPDYVLDPISGFVFVKENDNEIFALKFPDN